MTNFLTRSEVAQHNSTNSTWIIIGNKVYDVTKFLDEHPGGTEVLLEKAGEDRTEAFEDVGHSTDAREMRDQYYVGDIVESEKWTYSYDRRSPQKDVNTDDTGNKGGSMTDSLVYAVLFALIVAIIYYLMLA